MNDELKIFDWLLPLGEDEQFVGNLKRTLNSVNPIGGTELNYETGDLGDTKDEG